MNKPKLALVSATAVLGAAFALVLMLGSATPSLAAQINSISVDTNVTGNSVTPCAASPCTPGVIGSVEACNTVDVAANIDVDVVVNAVPSTGTAGAGFDILFDQTKVNVVSINFDGSHSLVNAATSSNVQNFSSNVGTANGSGDLRIDLADLDTTNYESGASPLIRVTFTGIAAGTSPLTLDDVIGGDGTPDVFDPAANPYTIGSVVSGSLAVGGSCGATVAPTTPAATTPVITNSPTPTPTGGPTGSVTATPVTTTPGITESPTPTPTECVGVDCPSVTPTPTPTEVPSETPSPTLTETPTATPIVTNPPTNTPTATPTHTPTAVPTSVGATATATPKPTCNTTLTSAAAANAGSIAVASAVGCDIGDTIKIGDTTDAESVKIAGVSGNTITLGSPLTKAHATGAKVVETASAPTPTASPKGLPNTGGISGDSTSWLTLGALAFGAALLLVAAGSVFAIRTARRED